MKNKKSFFVRNKHTRTSIQHETFAQIPLVFWIIDQKSPDILLTLKQLIQAAHRSDRKGKVNYYCVAEIAWIARKDLRAPVNNDADQLDAQPLQPNKRQSGLD
jgi:hypothetical protein